MSDEKIFAVSPAHPLLELDFRGKRYKVQRMTKARAIQWQDLYKRIMANEIAALYDAAALVLEGPGQEIPEDMAPEEAQDIIAWASPRFFRFGAGATGEQKKGSGPGPTGSPA